MKFSNKFVCEDLQRSTYEKNVRAPLFRKSFIIEKDIDYANITVSGLGFYDLFVNGKKITKGYLAPYISNTDHYIYYDEYDIKKYLSYGENVIGVMLGDGFINGKTLTWNFKDNVINSAPMLAAYVEIKCKEEVKCFEADDFVCKKGPILFNDLRSGIFYDARLWENGWNDKNFTESQWHTPILCINKPRGKKKICEAEPVKVYKEIKPISVEKGELDEYDCSCQVTEFNEALNTFEDAPERTGGYIYDFGENNSGIYRLNIKGARGQKISLQFAEQLKDGKPNYSNINFYPDGFAQRDIYYLSGDGEEIFEPMFTYHGYRYVYVSGITDEQASKDLLTFLVMSSDLEERGGFECSDERANKIYQMGRRSDISNFFYFPNDCPHREKNGWTGDASISAEHMIMTMNVENSWREWMHNIRSAQTEVGDLPGIVPTCDWGYGEGPAWDSVLFNLPYYAYKYRGMTNIIKENASAMLRYLQYISLARTQKETIEYGLGDWLPVGKNCDEFDSPVGFTSSVMTIDMCGKAEVMFDAVNMPLNKNFAKQLKKEMIDAVRQEFIDFDTYTVAGDCQTSQAMAIYFDIFEESEKEKAFAVLMNIIKRDNFNFTGGFLGIRVLFHVLSQFNETDLAYDMITKSEFPSYGYWLDKGETTFLESFIKYDEYFAGSKNHHFLGDVVNWFMSCPGGLKVTDWNSVCVKPCFAEKLDWCKTYHILPGGKAEIFWKRKEDKIELYVNVSENVRYEIGLDKEYIVTKKDKNKYVVEKAGRLE